MEQATVAGDMRAMFGPVTRWKTPDGIMYAENDFVKLAYVVFDPTIDRKSGIGDLCIRNDMICAIITAEQAKLWDNCECR